MQKVSYGNKQHEEYAHIPGEAKIRPLGMEANQRMIPGAVRM
jgi:hypothetical protein